MGGGGGGHSVRLTEYKKFFLQLPKGQQFFLKLILRCTFAGGYDATAVRVRLNSGTESVAPARSSATPTLARRRLENRLRLVILRRIALADEPRDQTTLLTTLNWFKCSGNSY